MITIFTQTPEGIIKSCIAYNPLWNRIQVHIDGTVYAQFLPGEYRRAKAYLEKAFSGENMITPDLHVITGDRPLEARLKELTGDPLTESHYDYLYGLSLVRHIRTGLVIQITGRNSLKEFIDGILKADGPESIKEETQASEGMKSLAPVNGMEINESHITCTCFSIAHHDRQDGQIWFFHVIRENEAAAKAQLFTYPPKERDVIDIRAYPVDIACINSTGYTCLERDLLPDNALERLMDDMDTE